MIACKFIGTFFGLFIVFSQCHAQEGIDALRKGFHAIDDKGDIETLLEMEVSGQGELSCPENAYKAASTAMMAKHVTWPGTKLKYFRQGTLELDALIQGHPCLESVYLRLLIQYTSPRFLGYHDSIQGDSLYFWSNMMTADIPQSIKMMLVSSLDAVSKQ